MKVGDLDRIVDLGFDLTINWGQGILIFYGNYVLQGFNIENNILVLSYTYPIVSKVPFDKCFSHIIELFNSWYLDNIDIIKSHEIDSDIFLRDKLVGLGDISDIVNRSINIDDILNEDYDF